MPIEHAVWKINGAPIRLCACSMNSELELEDLICADVAILNPGWLLVGRQVMTAYNKYIDLLAIDETGSLIIIELKKGKTPRDVVAQTIDYAAWVKDLDAAAIAEIYNEFSKNRFGGAKSLDVAFAERFKVKLEEDNLNSSHQMVVVATDMDSSTERIVKYINDYNIPLNVMFFRVFRDGENRYLSRAWFIDPAETFEQATKTRETEPWNGEFYVSFGHDEGRNWEDAVKYGFICAGGGRWYSRTLNLLRSGDRIWVNVPGTGYVGVGVVQESAVVVDEFKVPTEKGMTPILEAPRFGTYQEASGADEDTAEYFVRVKWSATVPVQEAKSEVGFFGNQSSVARPTVAKWPHTVARLMVLFGFERQS